MSRGSFEFHFLICFKEGRALVYLLPTLPLVNEYDEYSFPKTFTRGSIVFLPGPVRMHAPIRE